MMGMQVEPALLFYEFRLDDHVPADHLLRRIDRFLDLESVRSELRPFYSTIGQPSIDPELMMRMLIVGYCMSIRSERRLCEEVHLNLAYRWFRNYITTTGEFFSYVMGLAISIYAVLIRLLRRSSM